MAEIDTLIIGAGMTGLAVAHYANLRGIRCTVVERQSIGAGASGRNAGMIITGLGEHYARSIAGFGRPRARHIWEINRANHKLVRETIESERISCDYERNGSFALAWDGAECRDLEDSVAPLREDGFSAELLGPDELRARLGLEACSGALFSAEDAQVHPLQFVRGLAHGLRRRKVPIRERCAVHGIRSSGSGYEVETSGSLLRCARLVLATNAYTPQLLRDHASRITPMRGQCLAAVSKDAPRIPAPCYSDRGNVYWRSYDDHLIVGGFEKLSPRTEQSYTDAVTEPVQSALESFANAVVNGHFPAGDTSRPKSQAPRLLISHRWSGIMGYGFDWFPLIGEVAGQPGMYLAAGFTGHGFGYAFQAALWIAELLAGGSPEIPAFLSTERVRNLC